MQQNTSSESPIDKTFRHLRRLAFLSLTKRQKVSALVSIQEQFWTPEEFFEEFKKLPAEQRTPALILLMLGLRNDLTK